MSTVKYTGARYITKFADPIEWQANTAYEQIVACTYQGRSYISKCPVPKNIGNPAANPEYWLLWADPSAEMETLRQWVQDTTDDMVETVETYDERITQNTTDINHERYIAVIGDSWSNQDTEWPTILTNKTKHSLLNYAVAGSGFIAGGLTVTSQDQFINQLSKFKNTNLAKYTDYLIVYGGVNDWRNENASGAEMRDAMRAFLNSYLEIPKAERPKLIYCMNVGYPTQAENNGFLQWADEVFTRAKMIGFPGLCETSIYWPCGFFPSQFYDSDMLHPTKPLGETVISAYMLEIIGGTYDGVHFTRKIVAGSNIVDGSLLDCDISFDNGIISASLYATKNLQIRITSPSNWREMGKIDGGACGMYFGTEGTPEGNSYIECNGTMFWLSNTKTSGDTTNCKLCLPQLMFNPENGSLYFKLKGYTNAYEWPDLPLANVDGTDVFTFPLTTTSWSGKPMH